MRAQVGLGDLLRALHLHRERGGVDVLPLEGSATEGLRYLRLPEQSPTPSSREVELKGLDRAPPSEDTSAPRLSARSPLRMPEVWSAERLTSDPGDSSGQGASADNRRFPLLPAEELFRKHPCEVGYEDLVPLPRLAQPLATRLRQPRPGAVDLPALVRAASRHRWPRSLPRSRRLAWPHTLVVVLDQSDALYPYWEDMRRLSGWVRARVPKAQLRLCALRDGPLGAWRPSVWWPQHRDDDARPHPRPEQTYLLLSDLGLLRPEDSTARAWEAWLARAAACGASCVALAPVAAEWLPRRLTTQLCLLRWSPDSRAQPERGRPAEAVAEARAQPSDALHELLACLAATRGMAPPLLRALRQHSSRPNDASLEGRLWAHPDVGAKHFARLRDDAPGRHQHATSSINPVLSSALHALVARHHRHWPFVWRLEELLQQIANAAEPPQALLDDTRLALRSLTAVIPDAHDAREELTATVEHIQRHTPDRARVYLHTELDALAGAIGQPAGLRQRWCLLQRGEHLYVAPAGDARPAGPGVVLCSDIGQAAPGEWVRVASPGKAASYQRLPAQGMLALPPLQHGSVVVLGGVETRLDRRKRTRGVWGWSQSDAGVAEMLDLPVSKNFFDLTTSPWATTFLYGSGSDRDGSWLYIDRDVYGAFLELSSTTLQTKGYPPNLPLRFRYLESATFLQGSPEGIGYSDEHPQHPVTLSQGLWLAETPCTQALWQAVMGKNPSHFNEGEDAPRRPVENVSWDDVTKFLKKLQRLLPLGCEAMLPTESQWEYACRAGTQTAYWWGDEADDTRANWNQQHSGTTPVDRYPPNPWGLYDMHGNVWEWCRDGWRQYAAEPARDPEGPDAGESRVVRGGSWIDHPVSARAAYRDGWPRWFAGRDRGFRFALRSPSGPEARPGGPGARRGGAAGGRTDGADAPAAEPPAQTQSSDIASEE